MDLPDAISEYVESNMKILKANLNTAIVGEIVTFDPATVTAEIKIGVEFFMQDGTTKPLTNLLHVPIMVLQAGGFTMTFPVKAGDECLILFQMRDISTWIENGSIIKPVSNRQLNISDAVALVGIQSAKTRVQNYDPDNMKISSENASVTITPDGAITIDSRDVLSITADSGVEITGDVAITGDIEITGETLMTGSLEVTGTIQDSGSCLTNHTHNVSEAGDVTLPPNSGTCP